MDRQVRHPRPPLVRPWIFSPFFAAELAERSPTQDQRRHAQDLHGQGFTVVEQLIDGETADRIIADVAPLFHSETAIQQRRVQDAWTRGCTTVRDLAVHPRILSLLEFLYDRRPIPFQTLNFKWGTEQRGHADAIHFSCIPQGFMCGVWVALEDTDASNGPLFYYPGSHALPELNFYDFNQTVETADYQYYEDVQETIMRALGLEHIEFHAKRGDAIFWSSNLVHGGAIVRDAGRTRWSQVNHYYFGGGIYYTPVFTDFVSGELRLRDIVDLTTMEQVGHTYCGAPVTVTPLANGRSRIAYGQRGSETEELERLRQRANELERQVSANEERIADLLGSMTWKVGRLFVQPLAYARDRLQRSGRRIRH